jgi:anti-anti-sigma factor
VRTDDPAPTGSAHHHVECTLKLQFRGSSDQHLCIEMVGDLDAATAPSLRHVGAVAAAAAPITVQIDSTGVSFIDLTGHRALGALEDELRRRGMEIVGGREGPALTRLRTSLGLRG